MLIVWDLLQVFLSLSFYEDLGRAAKQDDKNKAKNKRGKKRKDHEDPRQMKENDKKGVGKNYWWRQERRCFLCLKKIILSIFLFQSFLPNMIKFAKVTGFLFLLYTGCCWLQGGCLYARCSGAEKNADRDTFSCIWNIFSHTEAHNAVISCQVC